jgi:hypothetical protein
MFISARPTRTITPANMRVRKCTDRLQPTAEPSRQPSRVCTPGGGVVIVNATSVGPVGPGTVNTPTPRHCRRNEPRTVPSPCHPCHTVHVDEHNAHQPAGKGAGRTVTARVIGGRPTNRATKRTSSVRQPCQPCVRRATAGHCCVGRKSDTTPAPREPGRVCEPNETADYGPHKSPI